MNEEYKLEQFEGPLDLLIGLIDDQKLSISEVSISEVTEQFLNHLEGVEQKQPDHLADFLVIATKLLFLKSKRLLPQFGVEEDEGPTLEDQLRLYKAFIEASKKLNRKWLDSGRSVFRKEPSRKSEEFVSPLNFGLVNLKESIGKLLYRLTPPKALPRTYIDKTVSIKEKIDQIRNLLKSSKETSFSNILGDSKNKTEVIVGFLALLELVKQKTISLKQKNNFSDINIYQV